ncbi:MAG: PAS domain-containing protein [Caulobacteraceae bacterium]
MPSQVDLSAAFYTADRQLVIKSVSDGALSIWGKSRSEVVGRRLLEVFPFLAGSQILNAHLEALRTFRPVKFTTTSHFLPGVVDVEIYPVAEGLQVRYWRPSSQPVPPDLAGKPET